ncbi:hypothetical protein [Alkalihalobacillus sp. R86527]|uniref:hypothetical protein n=1 Tax=Alkalihalobacillus sp. R86527 TaxID=3093863 RepID=UPI003672A49B
MKQFITTYSHWILLVIVGISFITMLIDFEATTLGITAIIMSGLGFLSLGIVSFLVEKNKRKQRHH